MLCIGAAGSCAGPVCLGQLLCWLGGSLMHDPLRREGKCVRGSIGQPHLMMGPQASMPSGVHLLQGSFIPPQKICVGSQRIDMFPIHH